MPYHRMKEYVTSSEATSTGMKFLHALQWPVSW